MDFSDRELSMNADEHESRVTGLDACSCDGGAAAAPAPAAGYPLEEAEKSSKELTVQSFLGESALPQDASYILVL